MPRGNRTGPLGMGPRTGRAMGFCSGYDSPGHVAPGPGLGFGAGLGRRRGVGFGRGMGRFGAWSAPRPYPAPRLAAEDELNILEEEAAFLSQRLEQITKKLDELKTKD